MPIINRRVRTVINQRQYNYVGLTGYGTGNGNFYLLDAATNFGNITVALSTTAGIGWAGSEDPVSGDNKAINYGASTYEVNGQTATFENVILE